MPISRILRWTYTGLAWLYTGGYFIYLLASAIAAWPHMTFMNWRIYVSWESVYALFWPILLLLQQH